MCSYIHIFTDIYICKHVCACVLCIHVCMGICICKRVCACGIQRLALGVSLIILYFETGSFTESGVHWYILASLSDLRLCSYPEPQYWGYPYMILCTAF